MPKFKDITGQKFGRLTAVRCTRRASRGSGVTMWLCICDCGTSKITQSAHLVNGSTQSCGCLQRETAKNSNKKHGFRGTRIYHIFSNMLDRCYNQKCSAYHNYGGRGIDICKEWLDDRSSFFKWSIENGYSSKLTIDRIDNNRGYAPDNCRWATREQQSRNTRSNVFLTIGGETKILNDWAEEKGINRKTLSNRIKGGWNLKDAISIPPVIGRNQSNQWRNANEG